MQTLAYDMCCFTVLTVTHGRFWAFLWSVCTYMVAYSLVYCTCILDMYALDLHGIQVC